MSNLFCYRTTVTSQFLRYSACEHPLFPTFHRAITMKRQLLFFCFFSLPFFWENSELLVIGVSPLLLQLNGSLSVTMQSDSATREKAVQCHLTCFPTKENMRIVSLFFCLFLVKLKKGLPSLCHLFSLQESAIKMQSNLFFVRALNSISFLLSFHSQLWEIVWWSGFFFSPPPLF